MINLALCLHISFLAFQHHHKSLCFRQSMAVVMEMMRGCELRTWLVSGGRLVGACEVCERDCSLCQACLLWAKAFFT